MNKIKKTGLGLLIATMAFGFSAFTTVKKGALLVYYKTDIVNYPNANDPRGYQYFEGDMCYDGGSLCSALWDIGTNPSPSDGIALPTSGVTYQSGSVTIGHFEP